MKKHIFSGRAWVLFDSLGRLIEDIDTDQIFHNAFLHITELSEMGQHALGNLDGWQDFPQKARPGDIVVAGRNFGAGSSRQQAVDCFMALKVGMLIAPSFGAIYYRNAVNSGFPILQSQDVTDLVSGEVLKTGEAISINIQTGEGENLVSRSAFKLEPMSKVQYDIWNARGLFAYARQIIDD
jgi:3-isopropylmalate/(R)-2-methylmalate dehydratase small subunit